MEGLLKDLESRIDWCVNMIQRHVHTTIDGTTPLTLIAFQSWTLQDTDAQTAANYGPFFVATRPCYVQAVSEVHTTAGTDGSAVTLQLERLQGTEAPGSGDELLITPFNLKGTANIVQRGRLVQSNKSLLYLGEGDRLALKKTGTLTSLKGVTVTVQLQFNP